MRSMLRKMSFHLVVLSMTMGLLACSDELSYEFGGNGGGEVNPSFDSTVDDDRLLSDLDESEAQQLAEDFAAGWSDVDEQAVRHGNCKLNGMFSAGLTPDDRVGACWDTYDECMAEPNPLEEETDVSGDDFDELVECSITVGEFFDCWYEIAEGLTTLGTQFECSDYPEVTDEDGNVTDEELNAAADYIFFSGPACTYMFSNCEDLVSE